MPPAAGGVGTAGLKIAELACDTDYEYFLDHGANTAARIESVVNTMNLRYGSEVGITHALGTVVVRSSSNDPYNTTDAGTFLNQLRNEWNANQGGVARDVAQLFTGKEINGGTIGIAWLGVVCNSSYGYGLVQSNFNNNFASATDFSAHELGHNWSADHRSCTSHTMNPYITSFRDSRTCLDDDGGGGGGDPTDVHVDSITPTNVNQGKGSKSAPATVVIRDDQGGVVSGAIVTVTFTGDVSATMSGVTGGDGAVTFEPAGAQKGKFRWQVCVTDVAASLPYDSADDAETCDQP